MLAVGLSFKIGNHSRQRKNQFLRQHAVVFVVVEQTGQVAGFPFAHGIECNALPLVTDVGIAEALQNFLGKGLQLLVRSVQYRQHLIVNQIAHKFSGLQVLKGFANGIYAAQKGNGIAAGVTAVEYLHLLLAVAGHVLYKLNIQSRFFRRKFFFDPLGGFDYPKVEVFPYYDQLVFKAQFFLNGQDVVFGEARYNAVDQRVAKAAGLFNPIEEVCFQFPFARMLQHVFFQNVPVAVDEFAGEENQALGRVALESLIALMQEGRYFSRKRVLGLHVQAVVLVPRYARLGGVGNHKAQLGIENGILVLFVVGVRIDPFVDAVDETVFLYGLAILNALEVNMVKAILVVKHVYHASGQGLNHIDSAVEVDLLVHLIHNPVGKGA